MRIAPKDQQLTLVERYAVRFLETTCDYYNIEDDDDAEVKSSLFSLQVKFSLIIFLHFG